ncbi:neurotrimin-like [Centruroides vittatus]|uniref:neurotrimin-like n=1 Tax=Centruroides vittatus TaxID=120091 RepID=UPI00350FAA01
MIQEVFACTWILPLITFTAMQATEVPEIEPEFSQEIPNVTVAVGRDAKLPCHVDNLGTYRVAWLRVESKTVLTIHRHVITRNYRINLTQRDHKLWILHINNVRESDRGGYMCQINTVPMKSQVGYLDVVVPPDIIDADSTTDVLVREGSNVTLTCRATGNPPPTVTWRREDGQPVAVGNWQSTKPQDATYEGEELSVTKVSRLHMGAYLCIASNDVPPSVSRRILLQVHFPPMIWIPNQLIGAPSGSNITLECHTEAYPMSINYWTKEDGDMLVTNDKYLAIIKDKTYKVHMKLIIRNIQQEDFGVYKCYAKNSLGSTEGSIRLYEIHVSPQPGKEPSTAKIQSLEDDAKSPLHHPALQSTSGRREDSRFGMSDATKGQNQPFNPPLHRPLEENGTSESINCKISPVFSILIIIEMWLLGT